MGVFEGCHGFERLHKNFRGKFCGFIRRICPNFKEFIVKCICLKFVCYVIQIKF